MFVLYWTQTLSFCGSSNTSGWNTVSLQRGRHIPGGVVKGTLNWESPQWGHLVPALPLTQRLTTKFLLSCNTVQLVVQDQTGCDILQ